MSDVLSAGRLEDHPFAELSGLIFQQNRTGELHLESGNCRRAVWFLGGNPVAVVSDDPQDHLAQVLLEHGKISGDDARRLAELPETRDGLGSADYVPKETLNWGVKSRFVNLCYDLFRWEEGDFSFRAGEPPRDLFLLKVPAHSLIFKGVGLLGQAAVVDAIPDEAVCDAGPIALSEARYLTPDAHHLLEQCRPGSTVAEALGGSADVEQARRLLYALKCLGLITLTRAAAAPEETPVLEEEPGFILDDDADAADPAPPEEESRANHEAAGFSLEDEPAADGFALDLPPLSTEDGALDAPGAEFDVTSAVQPTGGFPFEDESGAEPFGSFGSFNPDAPIEHQDESPSPTEEELDAPKAGSKRRGGRFRLPRIVGIALGSLAAAGIVALAGWWWFSGSEPPPSTVKRPAPTAAPVAAPAVPATEPVRQAVVPAPSPAAPAPPAPAPAPVVGAPTPPSPGVAAPASGADRYRNALEVFRAGDLERAAALWEAILAEEYRDGYTLQLLTACQHDTIREAQRSLSPQELYLITKLVNGRVCFRVLLGAFESPEAAGRALAALPEVYRSAGAAVRPVADMLNRDR